MIARKIPSFLAIFILIGLTLFFFWKILLTNLILVGVDTFLYFYPYKTYAAEVLRQGQLPLWNPHLFMGAPLLANSQVGVLYPLNWPLIWLDAPKQVAWSIGLHLALAGSLMFLFSRASLGLSWLSALTTAILFTFGGYLGAQVEHVNQLNAAAWLPLLFMLYDFGMQRKKERRWYWFLWAALVVALMLLAGHAQTVFIALFGLGLYALWCGGSEGVYGYLEAAIPHPGPLPQERGLSGSPFPQEREHPGSPLPQGEGLGVRGIFLSIPRFLFSLWPWLWPLLLVSGLAAALAAMQLWPTAELSALSIRSGGLTFRETVSFSLPPTTLHFTLLPPFAFDLSQAWGEAFSEWVAYIGISGLLLALLGGLSAFWQRPPRRFLWLAVAGLILSFGLYSGPLYYLLYTLVPGFDLFRVPARWLLLYAFASAILAGYGLEALSNQQAAAYLYRVWKWLRQSLWRLLIILGLPILFSLILSMWRTPPVQTLFAWLGFGLVSLLLILYAIRHSSFVTRAYYILPFLLTIELFWAAQSLNYNQPTAPQAFHSTRNATAFLQAVRPPAPTPPDRFLSLSGIAYDPGDLADLQNIYRDSLDPAAIYDLVIATKEKEVLFFNLPLLYGLHSVDGYDGGILPLRQFITLEQLFLAADDVSIDGRLREKLRIVPESRLLSLLNTRWIVTDKVFDAWIDGVFYDLQFPALLKEGQEISTSQIPSFPTTSLGVVSHLAGASTIPDDTPIAQISLRYAAAEPETLTLLAGRDTAEGQYVAGTTSHPQAQIGVPWPYAGQGVDYVTTFDLQGRQPVEIKVTALLSTGQFVLRGMSLLHQPTGTSRSLIISTEGHYRQVHSGDVKIYENLDVLPRAYLVHQAEIVGDDAQAVEGLKAPQFDPLTTFVRVAEEGEARGLEGLGEPDRRDEVVISTYQAEQIELEVQAQTEGWLILTDTYYPGWQATINEMPTEILQANLNFRAVRVPAGEHQVVFSFRPNSVRWGRLVSGLALGLVLVGLIVMAKKEKSLKES